MYAVIIEPMNAIIFLAERPEESDRWRVEDDVEIEIPSNIALWPEGSDHPQQILCRSRVDPKLYKLYKNTRDISRGEYELTGKNFGGIYSKKSWARFQELVPEGWDFFAPDGDESPESMDQATRAIHGDH